MKDNGAVYFRANTRDVNYINRIFEGYEHVGVVSTVDKGRGILVVRATPDTARDARDILASLPIPVEFIEESIL
ncbi:MAG: DUF4911 domain-containing protein [Negativicutes bacterium]|nr:DUF4911 domain-containing protein [Negativicutes bacterium]